MKAHISLAIVCLSLIPASVLFVYSLQTFTFRVPSVAQIKAIGIDVFEDANLTTPLTSINWGLLEPGENKTETIYVQSTSNTPIILWLFADNWNPANATLWIDLTWDYDGSLLQPDETITTVLTLATSENVTDITTFSFDITIIGEG